MHMRGILSVAQRTGESVLTRTCIDASSGKIRKDILPILPNPKEAKRRGKRILEMFLPVGYPHTVHPNYPWFSWWNFVQTFTGSVAGVLATQSLLYGLGVTKTAGQAAPLAATLNWILKDGLGQLGGIFFVGAIGHRFDVEAKRYRMIAAICMVFATLAELLVPILPGWFLPLAAGANALKNVSWMATSATRAQIQRHLCGRQDNLGDMVGKAASQNTLASLLGMGVGAWVSARVLPASPDAGEIVRHCLSLYLPLILVYLGSAYQSCRYAVSPRLTLQRFQMILQAALPHIAKTDIVDGLATELSRYILPVELVNARESFLFGDDCTIWKMHVEPDFYQHIRQFSGPEEVAALLGDQMREGNAFVLLPATEGVAVWFVEESDDASIVTGLLTAALLSYQRSKSNSRTAWPTAVKEASERASNLTPILLEAISRRGWRVAELSKSLLDPLLVRRGPLVILEKHED